jgi:hypothetical protein
MDMDKDNKEDIVNDFANFNIWWMMWGNET